MVKFTSVVFVFGVVAAVLLQCAAARTVHVVGDSLGWTVPRGGASDMRAGLRVRTFNFTTGTGAHDVLRVPKESHDSCSSSNPIGGIITTGPINITLSNT
ncbi:hypothetical protein F2P56_028154, partial [Juglans regia]